MRVPTAEPHSFINLQGGWPTPRLHPVKDLEAASASIFRQEDAAKELLRYGPGLGRPALRDLIGKWLNDFYAPAAGSIPGNRIGETNGASNGLATILQKFTDPVYTRAVWMVEPTYFLACPIFRDAGLIGRIRGTPEASDGVDLDVLARSLQEVDESWPDKTATPGKSPKLGYPKIYRHVVYLIPTFSNPSGKTMSLESRRRLVRLARKHDALLITDDVYDVLRWPANEGGSQEGLPSPPPRLVDVDRELEGTSEFGNAVSNGSFSKIVAPGMRLGWIEATPVFTTFMRTVGATGSGGGQAHFSSLFVEKVLENGAFTRHINEVLIPTYRKRYHGMMNAIRHHLYPLGVRVVAEDSIQKSGVAGGFFLYITFGEGVAGVASEISRVAFEDFNLKIGPGHIFGVPDDPSSENRGRATYYNGARLCWAWHEEEEIVEGIVRLTAVVRHVQRAMR
ncbi:aminotransferase [Colletotrichum truncatum]|uniref:Aminotransferase n=1 Tax=Colletotrichum truncatum TaxID=5467 RepID=A0ACC3Z8J2_COLTU|nr:aminotransferase [Colletotrichum truncatum]KAF6789203.1 aminotransferase [Colletotrichum truncatum]